MYLVLNTIGKKGYLDLQIAQEWYYASNFPLINIIVCTNSWQNALLYTVTKLKVYDLVDLFKIINNSIYFCQHWYLRFQIPYTSVSSGI